MDLDAIEAAEKAMTSRIREQDAEIERLERQLELERGERREKDIAAACDHLHETIHRLRALCGRSIELVRFGLDHPGVDDPNGYDVLRDLEAASKGEQ